ncbi:MAG: hypothetical protein LBT47_12320 [Deltaproteobacteria bacterium]|jgi:hypothetical protein|nr:hypothetical protein [Deltaproteobacteria bacterium]
MDNDYLKTKQIEAAELAKDWIIAVVSGNKEKSKILSDRIRNSHDSHLMIISAISRLIGITGQSFSSLISGFTDQGSEINFYSDNVAEWQPIANSPAVPISQSFQEKDYKSLLLDFQKKVSWDSPENEISQLKSQILQFKIEKSKAQKEEDIKLAEKRGLSFKVQEQKFNKALKKGPLSDCVLSAYQTAEEFYKKKAEKNLTNSLMLTANRLVGDAERFDSFIQQATERYPFAAESLAIKKGEFASSLIKLKNDNYQSKTIDVYSGAEHRINFLNYSSSWTTYIDETGLCFNPANVDEVDGKVVAIVVPDSLRLPQIDPQFHATTSLPNVVLSKLNSLLSHSVGILGFTARSLHVMNSDDWFQNIRALLGWIWRLLPLPGENAAKVVLNVIIENRRNYTPDINMEPMAWAINQDWDKENHERHKYVTLGNLGLAPKGIQPGLAWADVTAYLWGSSKTEIKKGLKQSGLVGTCLFDLKRDLLALCVKALIGCDLLTGPEWQRLMEENDADRQGSLVQLALESTMRFCLQSHDQTRIYIEALRQYLDTKKYDLKILNRQIKWLSQVNAETIAPDLRFYWESAKLAHHNHLGDFSSESVLATRKKLQELIPGIGQKDPQSAIEARLRFAVMSFNAFDFSSAKNELAPYDETQGGRLPEDGLSAGKVLSCLGQLEAFLGNNSQALELFDRAAEAFSRLVHHPEEVTKQFEQTNIYAAIAAMDDFSVTNDEKRRRIEVAIGKTVVEASHKFSQSDTLNETRYLHHLLTRYLVNLGHKSEKAAYLLNSSKWLIPGLGFINGHPWYLIQYYRWLMLTEAQPEQQKRNHQIRESIFEDCMPASPGLTIDFIGLALEVVSGRISQLETKFKHNLVRLQEKIPKAEPWLKALENISAESGHQSLTSILPFNYR